MPTLEEMEAEYEVAVADLTLDDYERIGNVVTSGKPLVGELLQRYTRVNRAYKALLVLETKGNA